MRNASPLAQSARAILFRGASLVGSVFTQSVCARGLGPGAYGGFGVILANLQIGAQVADLGAEPVTTRLLGTASGRSGEVIRPLITVRLVVGTALLAITALGVLLTRPEESVGRAILLGALSLPLGSLASGRALLVATHRFDQAQAALLANSALVLALLLIAAAAGRLSLTTALAATAAGALLSGVLISSWTTWLGWRAPPQGGPALSRLKDSLPLAGSYVVGTAATRVPPTIVASIIGTAGAGFFYAGYKLFDLAHTLPQNVMPSLFPWLVALRPATKEGKVSYRQLSAGLLTAGGWLGAAFASGAPLVVTLLYGSRFAAAIPVLATVGLALPFLFVSYAQGNLLIAQGHYSDQLRVTTVSAISAITFYPLLCITSGLAGAAWAAVACEVAAAATGASLVWRRFHTTPFGLSEIPFIFMPWLAAGVFHRWHPDSAIIALVIAALCASGGLLVLARVLSRLPAKSEEPIVTPGSGQLE